MAIMNESSKTKRQLIEEIAVLKNRIRELEKTAASQNDAMSGSENEKSWMNFFNAMNDSVCLIQPDGRIIKHNQATEKILDKTGGELDGHFCFEAVHGTSDHVEDCPLQNMKETKCRASKILPLKDRWVEVTADPILDENSNIVCAVHIITDITRRKQMEDALLSSEERFKSFVNTSRDWFRAIDINGCATFSNPAVENILGYRPEEIVGVSADHYLHPDDLLKSAEILERCIKQKTGWSKEVLRWRHRNGFSLYLESSAVPILDNRGTLQGFQVLEHDISDSIHAAIILRDSEQRLEDIINFLPDATFVIDRDGHVILWNRAMEELTGVQAENMLGKTNKDYSLPFYGYERPLLIDLLWGDKRNTEKNYTEFIRQGDTLTAEVFLPALKETGAYLWGIAKPLYDSSGNTIGAIESLRVTTERKATEALILRQKEELEAKTRDMAIALEKLEKVNREYDDANNRLQDAQNRLMAANEALRQSEEKFSRAFHLGPVITTISTLSEGKYVEVSDFFLRMTGYTREEVIGHTSMDLGIWKNPEDREKVRKTLEKGRRVVEEEILFQNRFGNVHHMLFSAEIVSLGGVAHLVSVAIDLTERRKVEMALRESEASYRTIFAQSPYPIFLSRKTGEMVDVNMAYLKVMGLSCQDVIGKSLLELGILDPETNEELRQKFEQGGNRLDLVEVRMWSPAKKVWMTSLLSSIIIHVHGEPMVLSMMNDVTAYHQALDALRESEQRYARAVSATSDAIWEWNLATNEIYYSPRWYEMLGYSGREEELRQISWKDICPPEDYQRAMAMIKAAIQSPDPVKYETEFRMKALDGTWRVILGRGNVVSRDQQGKALIFSGTNADITERKLSEQEKERLREQLTQAQKMESVGRLAGGIAHDFNNMLGVILGHSEMAMMKIDSSQPLYKEIQEIRKAAERSADLTRQLLAFARRQTAVPIVLNLDDTVEGMLKMLRRLIGEDIDLVWKPGASLWKVKMDPSQIDQILANLCVNARDAISGVGKIVIETKPAVFDPSYCARNPSYLPGSYVRIAISDNGCGMDKKTLDRLFEPFFTTKALGKGTGLGLATVYGIVKQNQGFINVYSETGQGATFSVYLRRYTGKTDNSRQSDSETSVPRGNETILLVEDEPVILEMTATMLVQFGYQVLKAETPKEAIRKAKEYQNDIHLLITDVVMPEMNGRDLTQNILSLYPKIRILFMSGYTADIIAHQGVLDEGVHFIQKPFSLSSLANEVRRALDHSS